MTVIECWTLRWVEPEIAPNDRNRPNALVVGPRVRWHGREVEVVAASHLEGAVAENERLRQVIMLARDRLDALPINPRLIIARDGLDSALDGGQS